MIHPASLGEGLKRREVEAPDLLVGQGQEVVLQDEVHFFEAGWPIEHANFRLDGADEVDVGTPPSSQYVVHQGIFRPPLVRLVKDPDKEL